MGDSEKQLFNRGVWLPDREGVQIRKTHYLGMGLYAIFTIGAVEIGL